MNPAIVLALIPLIGLSAGLTIPAPPLVDPKSISDLPEFGLNVEEFIAFYDYTPETHEVTTEDGYILSINHILPLNENAAAEKGVVLLVPGLLCDTTAFMVAGKESSLAFVLVEAGYDVWLMNYRGTTYSRKHVTLDPEDDKDQFWDYSFHEMGYYDATATIDHILEMTGEEKLFFIGHSQGTSTFFSMAAARPEYNDKIRLSVALAPIAYMEYFPNVILNFLAENIEILKLLVISLDFYELLPHWDIIGELGLLLCNEESPFQDICIEGLRLFVGLDEEQTNKTTMPLMLSGLPAGVSRKQLYHYQQEIISGKFQQYNYGVVKNLARYGTAEPPLYDVSKITAPVALFIAKNDFFAGLDDVDRLADELPNLAIKYEVDWEKFTHLDFMTAIDLNSLVNDHVLDVMENY